MTLALDILGWACLLGGGFFCVVGAIGLNRFPDVFTRAHAASVIDTLGVGLLILGMLTQTTDWAVAVRLIIILIVLYVTGAVASHALARAALHNDQRPLIADPDGTLKPLDPDDFDPEFAERCRAALVSEQVSVEEEVQPSNS